MQLSQQFQAALAAVQFLTRIPVEGGMNRPNADPKLLRLSILYFPLVGGLIGLATGAIIWTALLLWPPVLAICLGLTAEALLTGALHEDAVADCGDAFGGGWTRDDILRILRDSRIGSYGVLALILVVVARGGCLWAIPAEHLFAIVAASTALGRWSMLLLMCLNPPERQRDGLAKAFSQQINLQDCIVGALLALPFVAASILVSPFRTAIAVCVVIMLSYCWASFVKRRIGGMTGDCLGCGCYLSQLAFLLCLTSGPLA